MKKLTALLSLICIFSGTVASAFTFPSPDWGALYNEKTEMVTATDFELYAQAPIDTAPYFNAKFEPRGGAYIGSVADTCQKVKPLGAYLTNIDDMNYDNLYYPANTMVKSDDVITMVGWTIYDINKVDYNHIRKTLDNLNSYNKPMFIRFANEMNCSSLGDNPTKYIEVFRNVANMVHEYPNFAVVWSPNDLGALDRPFEYFYPGDEYVDWIGVSSYIVKYFQGKQNTEYKNTVFFMTGAYSWSTNKIKPIMDFIEKNNIKKPVMISEGGVATSNNYGEEYQSWTTPRLRNMLWYLTMKYPQIKMINYFDYNRPLAAEKFDISQYQYAVDIFNEAKNSGAYITKYGSSAEFVFQKANNAGTLLAENGKIPLYTLAYIANQPDLTVNYFVDGKWYFASTQIPYKCELDISGIADGKHTLKISTINNAKEYTFYKVGNYISFGKEPTGMAQLNAVKVTIDGKEISFDQPPVIIDGRTLVPLRKIFEALGAEVFWDGDTQTVTSVKGDTKVVLSIGSNALYVNGTKIELDVPAQLINSKTMVPARAVAESFGCKVDWNGETRTVIINN